MTKTCPDCQAEVLSTSHRMGTTPAQEELYMKVDGECCYGLKPLFDCQCEKDRLAALAATPAVGGAFAWRALAVADRIKEFLSRERDYAPTYILQDAEAMLRRLASPSDDTPAVGGEALRAAMHITAQDREYASELLGDLGDQFVTNLEIAAQWFCKVRYETFRKSAAQPASPLRGRGTLETLIREYARDLRRNSSGGDDYPREIMKGVADYLDILIGRASPPEQPAAAPVICRDCGKREPCDDDCPNYVDQEVTSNNKESEDAARLDFIEQATKRSRTGVSFDWIPSVEGERSGYRFMRHHNIGEPRSNIRDVIDVAMAALSPTAAPEYQQEVHWSSSGEADAYDEASAATEQLEQVDAEDIWSNYCTEVAEENRSPQGALAFAVETVVEIIAGGLVANPAAATDITDEMVLAGAKAANPFAWDKGECTLEYSARNAMLDEIRQILTAALSPENKETQA